MMPVLRLCAAALTMALPTAEAVAEPGKGALVVVELYTSQGCVSCPPADALLVELAKRRDLLPLALHVDYWDYIGWQDTFGSEAFTERQKTYARRAGERSIYTPQMVIGGDEKVVGFDPSEVARLIAKEQAEQAAASVELHREADRLTVHLAPLAAPVGTAEVQLVRFLPEASVDILRGENAGKTVVYTNIVTEMQQIGTWDGTAPVGLEVAVEGDEAIAVLVQADGQGPVLGAARID